MRLRWKPNNQTARQEGNAHNRAYITANYCWSASITYIDKTTIRIDYVQFFVRTDHDALVLSPWATRPPTGHGLVGGPWPPGPSLYPPLRQSLTKNCYSKLVKFALSVCENHASPELTKSSCVHAELETRVARGSKFPDPTRPDPRPINNGKMYSCFITKRLAICFVLHIVLQYCIQKHPIRSQVCWVYGLNAQFAVDYFFRSQNYSPSKRRYAKSDLVKRYYCVAFPHRI